MNKYELNNGKFIEKKSDDKNKYHREHYDALSTNIENCVHSRVN